MMNSPTAVSCFYLGYDSKSHEADRQQAVGSAVVGGARNAEQHSVAVE